MRPSRSTKKAVGSCSGLPKPSRWPGPAPQDRHIRRWRQAARGGHDVLVLRVGGQRDHGEGPRLPDRAAAVQVGQRLDAQRAGSRPQHHQHHLAALLRQPVRAAVHAAAFQPGPRRGAQAPSVDERRQGAAPGDGQTSRGEACSHRVPFFELCKRRSGLPLARGLSRSGREGLQTLAALACAFARACCAFYNGFGMAPLPRSPR